MVLRQSNLMFHHCRHHHRSNPELRRCRNRMANGIGRFGRRYHRLHHSGQRLNRRSLRRLPRRYRGRMAAGLRDMKFPQVVLSAGELY